MFHSYLSIKGHFFVISKLNKNTSNLTIQWFRVCAPRPLGESWDATPGSYCQRLLTFEGTENCSFRSRTSSNLSFVSEHPQKPWVFSVVLYVGHLYLRQGMVLSDVTVARSILPLLTHRLLFFFCRCLPRLFVSFFDQVAYFIVDL